MGASVLILVHAWKGDPAFQDYAAVGGGSFLGPYFRRVVFYSDGYTAVDIHEWKSITPHWPKENRFTLYRGGSDSSIKMSDV
jgi:hypothetical protein